MRLQAIIKYLTVNKETKIKVTGKHVKLETKTKVDSVKTPRPYWRLRDNRGIQVK
jgi:hypothetical protein